MTSDFQAILIMSIITLALRVLPFVTASTIKSSPTINQIGKALPPITMLLLVAYCLKGIELSWSPHGFPLISAALITAAAHISTRNPAVSIGSSTIYYTILVNSL